MATVRLSTPQVSVVGAQVEGGGVHGQDMRQAVELSGDVVSGDGAEAEPVFGIVEEVACTVGIPQALVDMSAAAGQRLVDLGHERGHDAVAVGDLLDAGLEEDGPVGRLHDAGMCDGALVGARARLGMEAFDGDAEGRELVEEVAHVGVLQRAAQDGIAEHAGRQRGESLVVLGLCGGGRLVEVEPFELLGEDGFEAGLPGLVADAFEELPGADGRGTAGLRREFSEQEGKAFLPGDGAEGIGVEACRAVGEARMPASVGGSVVQRVGGVPSEDDVAEGAALCGDGTELVEGDVLPAEDPVDVGECDLHLPGGMGPGPFQRGFEAAVLFRHRDVFCRVQISAFFPRKRRKAPKESTMTRR
jgi:hypothetical protein